MSEAMNISSAGLRTANAGISVVNSTADIRGEARSGSHATPVGLYATANLGQSSGGIEFRHSNGTQGVGFGYNSVYAAGSNTNQDLNFYSKGSGIIYANSAMTCSSSLTPNSGISTTTLTASSSITLNTTGSGGSIISGSRPANTTEPLIVLKANAGGNNRGAIGWSGTQLYAWSTPNPNGDVGSAYNYVPQNSAWGFRQTED